MSLGRARRFFLALFHWYHSCPLWTRLRTRHNRVFAFSSIRLGKGAAKGKLVGRFMPRPVFARLKSLTQFLALLPGFHLHWTKKANTEILVIISPAHFVQQSHGTDAVFQHSLSRFLRSHTSWSCDLKMQFENL